MDVIDYEKVKEEAICSAMSSIRHDLDTLMSQAENRSNEILKNYNKK